MSFYVWISLQANRPDGDPDSEPHVWMRIGRLDTSVSNDIAKAVGKRSATGVRGYVMGDMSVPWVTEMVGKYPQMKKGMGMSEATERFWVAVSQTVTGGRVFFVSNKRAKFGMGRGNPPEQHVAWTGNHKPLSVQLMGSSSELLFSRA